MTKKVLIVEDEFIVANDLRLLLMESGYKVIGIAASTTEADEYVQRQKPDLVILDIRLEGKLSGIDLARKLKAENIAFIYLSANSSQKVLEEAKATEPYGFLVKPFREKDLLVTLDIAWYLHEHSLASKLRQEQHLQQQLAAINNATSDVENKLLKIARAIQPHIPFDFIGYGIRPFDPESFIDAGYLRIGFDEYQFIREKELLTISGINKNTLREIIENTHTDKKACIYNAAGSNENIRKNGLQKIMMNQFQLESLLVFPVAIGYGVMVHYFFYSRKSGIYTNDHISALNRLKTFFDELAEKTLSYETTAIEAKSQPVRQNKKVTGSNEYAGFNDIIGSHHLLLTALDLATQVAPYNTSVLLLGESGTGKERIAQSVHALSPVKNGPFIKINCAAIPETLIESEL
ncbi:MAG TPA: response regulator, partial [Chitinophagaceae bacterium]|nr:response regulator [Chitinophagaceae bacterium]